MSHRSRREYLRVVHRRYGQADRRTRQVILNEFCLNTGYNRKYAIRLLNGPAPDRAPTPARRRRRAPHYAPEVISVLGAIWAATGYPWSVRLKAAVPLWWPWIREQRPLRPALERQLFAISARQIDRRLQARKRRLKRRLYGRTRPGVLLKHQIPIQAGPWQEQMPGFAEVDLVSHSGNSASGEFAYSLNLTDLYTTWTETRAILGRGFHGVVEALEEIRTTLPFRLWGIDSDNGSEFINWHVGRWCHQRELQFTRSRPYKKDDNAHIEQKNWTHVRKLLGWERYDTPQAVEALNDLYRHELRLWLNLYLPSVKLARKVRVGSRLRRVYGPAQTPLDRVAACPQADPDQVEELKQLRARLDPFELARTIDQKLQALYRLADHRLSPKESSPALVTF
jgi:hypothetical protein